MELTLTAMLEAMGGWDVVWRTGAAVAVSKLIIDGLKAAEKKNAKTTDKRDVKNFFKIGTALIASAIVSMAWGCGAEWRRDTLVTFFMATFVWRDLFKNMIQPLIAKFGKNGIE